MTATATIAVPASPYKGLSPFDDSPLDALLFFGRSRETEIVAANVLASRLTVLYGPSGVGKSSLLRAGCARARPGGRRLRVVGGRCARRSGGGDEGGSRGGDRARAGGRAGRLGGPARGVDG
jgi:hypothetical protein